MSKFEKTPLPSRQKKVRIEPKSRFIPTKIGESYIKVTDGTLWEVPTAL